MIAGSDNFLALSLIGNTSAVLVPVAVADPIRLRPDRSPTPESESVESTAPVSSACAAVVFDLALALVLVLFLRTGLSGFMASLTCKGEIHSYLVCTE